MASMEVQPGNSTTKRDLRLMLVMFKLRHLKDPGQARSVTQRGFCNSRKTITNTAQDSGEITSPLDHARMEPKKR